MGDKARLYTVFACMGFLIRHRPRGISRHLPIMRVEGAWVEAFVEAAVGEDGVHGGLMDTITDLNTGI